MTVNPLEPIIKFTRSLSFKLSFYAGLIMFLAILAFTYRSISAQEDRFIERRASQAMRDSKVIKAAIWNGMMTKNRQLIHETLRTVAFEDDLEQIAIFDQKGVVHYYSGATQLRAPEKNRQLLDKIENSPTGGEGLVIKDNQWLYVIHPIPNEAGCSSSACHAPPSEKKNLGALELKLSLNKVKQESWETAKNTGLFAFGLFLFISSIIGLAVIFLVNPQLKRLQLKAAALARGELMYDDPNKGSDEFAELEKTFDEMSRQVNLRTEHLDARRKMYKALFDEVPCYLTLISKDYRIVKANRAFRDTFGDLEGRNCFKAYKGLDSKCPDCPVEKTFATGKSYNSEEVWRLRDREANVFVTTSPLVDDSGNVVEVMEMSVDFTSLKRLQRELEKRQREYQQLFEKVPCYLTVVDKNYQIIQANRLFEQDFGKGIGRKCFRIYKKRESRCDNCPVEKTFADGNTHTSEEVWRRDGEETHIIAYTAPLYDNEGIIYAVMEMCTNITEVKRLQSELILLGETIAGMSHTIKNIVNGLQGGVYMVDSGLEKNKEDRVKSGWQIVKKNVETVSDLVHGILYASKERPPEYKQVDPSELLNEVCDLYSKRANDSNIEIVRDFEGPMPDVMVDPAGLHSVLSNLVSNAVQACEGSLGDNFVVTVSAYIVNSSLRITVKDNGPGIAKDVKNNLFRKFYSTKGAKGTGLGLVITRKIVKEHGGAIEVESEPGRGTIFRIVIPRAPDQDAEISENRLAKSS